MAVRDTTSKVVKSLSIGALLLAGAALAANILVGPAGVAALTLPAAPATAAVPVPVPVPAPVPASAPAIALAPAEAAAVTTPSAADAWGGARTGSEATLSERVADYQITATLDPIKHTVEGRQKLTWRNRSAQTVGSVYLHLYLNAFEGPGSTFFTEKRNLSGAFRSNVPTRDGEWGHTELRTVRQNGAAVGWVFVHPDHGPATDHTVVRLDLPTAVAAGATTTLDIDFHNQLPRVVARSGYFGTFHLVGQWFPKIAVLELPGERGATAPRWNAHEYHLNAEFYADYGNYDVTLSVPTGFTVAATGVRQGPVVERGGMATSRYVQGDVHDFAWSADSRSARPLESEWRGAGSPPVKVTVVYPPEYLASAAPAMKAARDALDYFSRTLGPYPYRTLTVVIPPHNAGEAGGMEYPTFVTIEGYTDPAPGRRHGYELDFVTVHEFGHGYFYGILGSNESEEPMLDEGLNQYWGQRLFRERGQDIDIAPVFLQKLGIGPRAKVFDYARMVAPREDPADPLGQNAYDRLQGIGPIYDRTATVLRDLEAQIGKPAMQRAFKQYYQRWKFRHPSVADLRESLAEASGRRALVEQVFAQQVYQVGKVDDRVDAITSVEVLPGPGSAQVKGVWVEERQGALDARIAAIRRDWDKAHPHAPAGSGPFPYRTSVTLRRHGVAVAQTVLVKFADGSSETVVWDKDERWRKLSWEKPAKAVSAELDPQRRHYLDTNKLDDSRTVTADPRAARRWGGEFAALVQILLALIATV